MLHESRWSTRVAAGVGQVAWAAVVAAFHMILPVVLGTSAGVGLAWSGIQLLRPQWPAEWAEVLSSIYYLALAAAGFLWGLQRAADWFGRRAMERMSPLVSAFVDTICDQIGKCLPLSGGTEPSIPLEPLRRWWHGEPWVSEPQEQNVATQALMSFPAVRFWLHRQLAVVGTTLDQLAVRGEQSVTMRHVRSMIHEHVMQQSLAGFRRQALWHRLFATVLLLALVGIAGSALWVGIR